MNEVYDILSIAGIMTLIVGVCSMFLVLPELKKFGNRNIDICIEKMDKWKITEEKESEWLSEYFEKGEF